MVNKKLFLAFIFFALLKDTTDAQTPSNRIRFKYRISKEKLKRINATPNPLQIEDAYGNTYQFCHSLTKPFKTLITFDQKTRTLFLEPWHIKPNDVACQTAGIINSKSPNNLKIPLPGIALIGDESVALRLHYQAWLIGVNSIGAKFRSKVKDYNGNIFDPNVVSGNINLGLSVGYSYGWTNFKTNSRPVNSFSLTPGLSLGFSSVALAKEPLKKQVNVSFSPSNFVLSPAFSIIIARNDLGLLLAYGNDIMFGKNANAWAYQGKSFFGFGFSAGLRL